MQSAKPVFFPADELLWRGRRNADEGFSVETGPRYAAEPVALFGVRSCDLAAVGSPRRGAGLTCVDRHPVRVPPGGDVRGRPPPARTLPGRVSARRWVPGRSPTAGYDIALTELLDGEHRFLAEAGTGAGEELLARLQTERHDCRRRHGCADAGGASGRRHGTHDAHRRSAGGPVLAGVESPHWDDVASRCLACQNCTMVCPTCFCTSVEDVSDLTGDVDERHRVWDSCFSQEYSRLHTNFVRASTGSRYRQWITHKLACVERPVRDVGLCRVRSMHHVVPGCHRHHRRGRGAADDADRTGVRGRPCERSPGCSTTARSSTACPSAVIAQVAGCAQTARFERWRHAVPRGAAGRHVLRDPAWAGRRRTAQPVARHDHAGHRCTMARSWGGRG